MGNKIVPRLTSSFLSNLIHCFVQQSIKSNRLTKIEKVWKKDGEIILLISPSSSYHHYCLLVCRFSDFVLDVCVCVCVYALSQAFHNKISWWWRWWWWWWWSKVIKFKKKKNLGQLFKWNVECDVNSGWNIFFFAFALFCNKFITLIVWLFVHTPKLSGSSCYQFVWIEFLSFFFSPCHCIFFSLIYFLFIWIFFSY